MKYDPKDAAPGLMPVGEYDAECIAAEDKKSKKGNPMMVVTTKVFGTPETTIVDYFVADLQSHLSKLKKLCAATGVDFDSGEVDPRTFVGKSYRVVVGIAVDKSGQYDDKNSIRYYLSHDAAKVEDEAKPDDGIPF